MHKFFSNIPFVNDPQKHLDLTKLTLEYLDINYTDHSLEIATILFFTISPNSIFKPEIQDETILRILDDITVKTKPSYLKDWSITNWIFFCLALFISDLFNLKLEININDLYEFIPSNDSIIWIKYFEDTFECSLDKQKKNYVEEKILKHHISNEMLLVDDKMLSIFESIDFCKLKDSHPLFLNKFITFWEKYESNAFLKTNFFKIDSLMISTFFVPLNNYLPEIKIFLNSNMTFLHNSFLKSTISSHFANYCTILFVDNISESELIIETSDIIHNEKLITPHVVIDTKVSNNDLENIYSSLERVVRNK